MKHGTHRARRPRHRAGRGWSVATAAGAALLALSACGSGGAPAVSSTSDSSVAYSACMRQHGIPNFPDPDPAHPDAVVGKESAQELGVGVTTYHTAHDACAHLIPLSSGDTPEQQQELQCAESGTCAPGVVQHWMSGLRSLAGCLRTHGEPTWPDPVITSLAGHPPAPHFLYDQAGIDHHSQKVLNEVDECIRITGFQGLPLP